MGWLTDSEWPAPTCAAGVRASSVSESTDYRVRSRASYCASNLAGSQHREGPSADAPERPRNQWLMGVGDGICWRARVEEASRGRRFGGRNTNAVSKRCACAGTKVSRLGRLVVTL